MQHRTEPSHSPREGGHGSTPSARGRIEPLPDWFPKPAEDDPQAGERIQALLSSSSYIRADQDVHFLERNELRPSRLAFDYLKTELILQKHSVESTIVVFGGTRILEPAAARRRLKDARRALEEAPQDPERKRRVAIAERVAAKSPYYDVAREFARIVSSTCQVDGRCEFVIATGGGPGIMEAGNRGAFDVDAKSIGLNITLPHEQFPNPYISPELCFQFRYFGIRKLHFMMRAKALVAFPGGFGTFDELFETLTLVQTQKIKPVPVVLVGEEFWRQACNVEFLAQEGVISPEDVDLFTYAETAQEIWSHINDWHRKNGEEIVRK
jgi:uncharacterized protein (TIGR00730 family)